MSAKIHAASFERYAHQENLEGPEVYEVYEPLCGTRPDDPNLTHDNRKVTCRNCLRMIGPTCPVCGVKTQWAGKGREGLTP